MLGFTRVSHPIPIRISLPNLSISNPFSLFHPLHDPNLSYSPLRSRTQINPRKFLVYAEEGNNGNNGLKPEPKEGEKNGGDEEGDLGKGNQRPKFSFRWVDLVLDPDPDNLVAVGLTGLLTWASVQVLWQLLFISLAILVAALKYSFIAALLIFILITLL